MLNTPDFSALPAFSWDRCNIGAKVTGTACFPTSTRQASSWASKLKRAGYRVIGLHHLDIPVQDWGYSLERVKWLLQACQSKGIAGMLEFRSQKPWNEAYVQQLAQLPNVVAASPSNEDSSDDFEAKVKVIRAMGFTGKLFRSNANIMGGTFGDLEDSHNYVGHFEVKLEGRYFFDTVYPEWSSKEEVADKGWLTVKTNLPRVMTEGGAQYPNPRRYESDVALYTDALAKGFKIVMPFALCTNEADWLSGPRDRDWFAYANDEARMDAVSWLASKLLGREFIPRTGNTGFSCVKAEVYPTSPTYRVP